MGVNPHRYSVHGSHLLGRCQGPLQATSPSITLSNPHLSQPRDHDSERACAFAGRIRRGGPMSTDRGTSGSTAESPDGTTVLMAAADDSEVIGRHGVEPKRPEARYHVRATHHRQ